MVADSESGSRPVLRIVRGEPTAAELVAVVVVLGARSSQPAAGKPTPRSPWAARDRLVRRSLTAGPGAWRASALPR
jgi:hypothetical protein